MGFLNKLFGGKAPSDPPMTEEIECIYCRRMLSGERLSHSANGWVCADSMECLAFQDLVQDTDSVSESDPPMTEEIECIYCRRMLSGERLSHSANGWVCADSMECLAFQELVQDP